MLSEHWPLFDLKIRTPRLELRYPSDDDLALLVALTREEIHSPDFMPFSTPWTRAESTDRERNALRFWWRLRATVSVDEWVLPFVVVDRGEPVGVQDLKGVAFPVTRSVLTGSWLVRRRQGIGIGKEMRAAVLHLAFAGFGAAEAHTSAFVDNLPSLGVTKSIGYAPNGSQTDAREGQPVEHLRFILRRGDWKTRRRDDIEVDGLDNAMDFLGIRNAHLSTAPNDTTPTGGWSRKDP